MSGYSAELNKWNLMSSVCLSANVSVMGSVTWVTLNKILPSRALAVMGRGKISVLMLSLLTIPQSKRSTSAPESTSTFRVRVL